MSILGILPAAGYAKRLGLPFIPKELLPVTYRDNKAITCIEGSILQLLNAGITDVVIVIRKGKEAIREYLGDRYQGAYLNYVYQETMKSREGLCDALMAAYHEMNGYGYDIDTHDTYLMLMPDVYFTTPEIADDLYEGISLSELGLALSVWETNEPWRFGVTRIYKSQVLSIYDKPENITERSWFWGAAAFNASLWPYIDKEDQTFSHAMNAYLSDGNKALAVRGRGEYLDIGTPESLFNAMLKVNS